MKTTILIFVLLFSLTLVSCSKQESDIQTTDTKTTTTKIVEDNTANTDSTEDNTVQPDRKMDIYWKITWIEWNEVTLLQVDTSKDPTFNMTPTQKKKYMQSMDEGARTALKEEINKATLWEIKLTVPVWIPMTKKEAQWPDAPVLEASLADLKAWQYISIWLNPEVADRKVAEFVKIAFTQ